MSPLSPDPYSILGVTKECKAPDIRKAYKLLALKFHPDKNQDADDTIKAQNREEFDKIQSAYDILKDDDERARYDEKARLADLRKTAAPKSNTSTPRTPKHYEVYTAEPRPNSFKSTPPPPGGKAYFSASYSTRSSYDDERRPSTRYYEEVRTPLRRAETYSEKSYEKAAKREEREREREKDRDRERRKARKAQEAEEARKMEKLEKDRRREERKAKDKQKSKDIKREMEDKRRDTRDSDAYIETFEEPPRAERKKSSSSRKHEEKRDRERERSSHRDEMPQPQPRYYADEPLPMPNRMDTARAYIHRSRSDVTDRGQSSYRSMPAVPTPPPAQASAFARPEEDDVRRSAARARHHSPAEAPSSSRERSHHKTSRERLDDGEPIVVNTAPGSRRGSHAQYPAEMSTSPPRLPRVNTMPTERVAPRPGTTARSQTFNVVDSVETPPLSSNNRGRGRSKLHAQVPDEESSDYDDLPRRRSTKHSSSSSKKKHRSPSRSHEMRYHVSDGRAKLQSTREGSYSRKVEPEPAYYYDLPYDYDSKGRPSMHSREPSYVNAAPMKVKTSKAYMPEDVSYSSYNTSAPYQGYSTATYA